MSNKKKKKKEEEDIDENKKILSVDHADVFGTKYEILLMEDMCKEDGQIGGLDVQEATILLDLDLDRLQSLCETLLHELTHGYAIKFGDIEEKYIDMITSAIFGFIVHNPELAMDIIRLAKKPEKEEG